MKLEKGSTVTYKYPYRKDSYIYLSGVVEEINGDDIVIRHYDHIVDAQISTVDDCIYNLNVWQGQMNQD